MQGNKKSFKELTSEDFKKMTSMEFDEFLVEAFSTDRDKIAEWLFDPIPELTEEEKREIEEHFRTSPTWREKERNLYITIFGDEYAREKGLLDD